MNRVLAFLWQLPQNLLGYFLTLIWKEENSIVYKGVRIRFNSGFPSGISLGEVVILKHNRFKGQDHFYYNADSVKHEWGHTRQSLKWGWLYLIVIGLPSLIGNIYDRIFHKGTEWYYNQPWEKSADKLGGVVRKPNKIAKYG